MPSGFFNKAGVDLDDIYQKVQAGQESLSIRNYYTGGDFAEGSYVDMVAGLYLAEDNGQDFIDRYIAVELGTLAPSADNANIYTLRENWTLGTEDVDFRQVAAAAGTAGQVPTWNVASSSKSGTFIGLIISDSISNTYAANGEGIPITGYRVASHTLTGNAELSVSSVTVNSLGTVTVNFDAESHPSQPRTATVTVYVEAQNAFGWSTTQHTHTFTITIDKD